MASKRKRSVRRFGRALLPPPRFHSSKRGKRGYVRRESRREERRARDALDHSGSLTG